ncbi:hypothetical protein N8223_00915 [Bacteroidia bacterium]|jgi:hypothetical protein|nr:hypothetical protein [Bacteroidia bacterium]
MEARITVEQYFMYEVVATFNAVVEWVKGENRSMSQWKNQVAKLKKAFHYFMLELEVDEFKDLRLPSEKQSTEGVAKSKVKAKSRRGVGVASKVKTVGKQLQLFFIKTAKSSILRCVIVIEEVSQWCAKQLMGEVEDFENEKRK